MRHNARIFGLEIEALPANGKTVQRANTLRSFKVLYRTSYHGHGLGTSHPPPKKIRQLGKFDLFLLFSASFWQFWVHYHPPPCWLSIYPLQVTLISYLSMSDRKITSFGRLYIDGVTINVNPETWMPSDMHTHHGNFYCSFPRGPGGSLSHISATHPCAHTSKIAPKWRNAHHQFCTPKWRHSRETYP